MKNIIRPAIPFLIVLSIIGGLIVVGFLRYNHLRPSFSMTQAENKKNIVPVLIIGSGPAGLSAALYTARAKLPTTVFTGHNPGGQLADVQWIENWPGKEKMSGFEAVDQLYTQVKKFSPQFVYQKIVAINSNEWPFVVTVEDGTVLHALSIIIATGRIARKLDVPGVDTYWGKGVGVCSLCDAPFHKGQDVAVIGGGDTACDRALQLADYATKVYMIVKDKELDANATVQEYIKKTSNITTIPNHDLISIEGDNTTINAITIADTKTGTQQQLPVHGVYFAIGYHPNNELVKSTLNLDDTGFINLQPRTQKTSIPGIFAAGDVTDKRYGKAGVATGSGIKAAIDAIEFLQHQGFTHETAQKLATNYYQPNDPKKIKLSTAKTMHELRVLLQKNKDKVVIVDIYADYCPTCKLLMPHLKSLPATHPNLAVIKVEYTKAPDIIKQFNILSIPNLLVFKDGKLIEQTNTVRSPQQLQKFVEKFTTQKQSH